MIPKRLGLVLALVAGLTASGQTPAAPRPAAPREWRDYGGGPDTLAVRRGDRDRQSQRQPAAGGLELPGGPDRLQSGRRPRRDLRPRPEQLVRRARRRDGQAALDPRGRGRLQRPRHQLLGEQGRQGPPADLQREQHAPGDRRANRRERSPSFGEGGKVDLREGLDRDPATINQQSRTPGRVFENLLILGLGDEPGVRLRARRHPRLRRADGQEGLDLPHRAAARRVRLRHLAEGRLEDHRRRQQLGRAIDRREARHRLHSHGQREIQLLRREPQGREPVRRLPARARRQDRQAALAFPDGPPRHLGSRQQCGAAADHHPPQRPPRRRRRDGRARPATSTSSIA